VAFCPKPSLKYWGKAAPVSQPISSSTAPKAHPYEPAQACNRGGLRQTKRSETPPPHRPLLNQSSSQSCATRPGSYGPVGKELLPHHAAPANTGRTPKNGETPRSGWADQRWECPTTPLTLAAPCLGLPTQQSKGVDVLHWCECRCSSAVRLRQSRHRSNSVSAPDCCTKAAQVKPASRNWSDYPTPPEKRPSLLPCSIAPVAARHSNSAGPPTARSSGRWWLERVLETNPKSRAASFRQITQHTTHRPMDHSADDNPQKIAELLEGRQRESW